MSTLKADAITSASSNTDVVITGAGSGVPDIEASFKVGGTAGVPMASIRTSSGTASSSTFLRGDGTWQAAGGAWSVKSSGTFSTASQLDVTSIAKYTQIVLSNVTFSAGASMMFRTSTDNGSSFATSGYHYHVADYDSARSSPTDVVGYTSGGTAEIPTSGNNIGTAATDEGHFVITLPNPADAAAATMVKIETMFITASAANIAGSIVVAMNPTGADVDALRSYPNTGTMSGSYVVLEFN
ncbi:MAG: hypothetical protein ABGY96_24315 [bacterium]